MAALLEHSSTMIGNRCPIAAEPEERNQGEEGRYLITEPGLEPDQSPEPTALSHPITAEPEPNELYHLTAEPEAESDHRIEPDQNSLNSCLPREISDAGLPREISDAGLPRGISDAGLPREISDAGLSSPLGNSKIRHNTIATVPLIPKDIPPMATAAYLNRTGRPN
ncbi:hypothetical protein H6P81_003127 [Aristolochia fimbriata]|uniref:Uncharacterized protein n=1 Tax=Aristolochia fimbriata TaxID=158543 RepID=A0AAV7FDI5_ARIFI|nr:hypothetical protein H6P81_003127 [Aristolochia fimbriata]